MQIRIGKNPEFTFSMCMNSHRHGGYIALPLELSWWNMLDCVNNRNISISLQFLCFNFTAEMWRWAK